MFRRFFRIGFGGCGCALEEFFRKHAADLSCRLLESYLKELMNWKLSDEKFEMGNIKTLLEKKRVGKFDDATTFDTTLKDIKDVLSSWDTSLQIAKGTGASHDDAILDNLSLIITKMEGDVESTRTRGNVLLKSLRVDSVSKEEATEEAHAHLYNQHIKETREMIMNTFGKNLIDSDGFNHRPELQLLCLSIKEVRNEVFKDIDKAIEEKGKEASRGYFFFVGFGGGTGTGVISPIAQRIGQGLRGYVTLGMLSGCNDMKYLKPQQKWFRRCFNTLLALNDLKTTGELTGIILADNDKISEKLESELEDVTTSSNESQSMKDNAKKIDKWIIKAIYPAFGETPLDDPNFGTDWSRIGKDVGSKSPFFVPCYAYGKKETKDLIGDAMENELVECNHKEKADKIFVFTRKVGNREEVEEKLKNTFGDGKNVAIIEKPRPLPEMVIDYDIIETLRVGVIPENLKKEIKKKEKISEELSFKVEPIEKDKKWQITAKGEKSESNVQYQYSISATENESLFSISKQTGEQTWRSKPKTVFQNLEEGKMEDKKKKKELLKIFRDNIRDNMISTRNPNIVISSINDEGHKSWKITISGDSSKEKAYIIEDADEKINIYEKGRLKLEISKIGEGSIENKFKSNIIVIETEEIGINDENENEVLMLLRVPDSSISSLKKRLEVAKKFVNVLDMVVRWVDGTPQKGSSIIGEITKSSVSNKIKEDLDLDLDLDLDPIGEKDGKKWIYLGEETIYFVLKNVHSLDIYSEEREKIKEILDKFSKEDTNDIEEDDNKKMNEILKEALLFLFPEDIPEEMVMKNYNGRMKGIVKNLKKEMGVIGRIDVSKDNYSEFKEDLKNGTVRGVLKNKCKEKSSRESRGEQGEGNKKRNVLEYRSRKIDENLYDICKSTGGLPFLFENPIFDLKSASASSNEVMLTSILAMDKIAYNKFRRVIGEKKFDEFFGSFIEEKLKNQHGYAVEGDGGKKYILTDEGVEILQKMGLRDKIDRVSSYVEIKSESDALTLLDVMGGIESFFEYDEIKKDDKGKEEWDFIEKLAFSALYAAQRRFLFSWDEKKSELLFKFFGLTNINEQNSFCEHLRTIGFKKISQLITDAKYSQEGDNLINITKKGEEIVATLQIENDLCYFKLKNGVAIKIGVVKDNGNIYTANREDKLKWYLKEDLEVDWIKNNVKIKFENDNEINISKTDDSSKKIKIVIDKEIIEKETKKAILNIRAGKNLFNMDENGVDLNGNDIPPKVKTELKKRQHKLPANYVWKPLKNCYMIKDNDPMGTNYYVSRVDPKELKISADKKIELNVVKKEKKYLVYKGMKEI